MWTFDAVFRDNFLTEAPPPRPVFVTSAPEEVRPEDDGERFQRAITVVLRRFPEAYHAVIEEVRRLAGLEPSGP